MPRRPSREPRRPCPLRRRLHHCRRRERRPTGPASADPSATASCAASRIATDWAASPPVELWRRAGRARLVVVRGAAATFVYTQEQRGDDEVVACYDVRPARRSGRTATRRASSSRTAAPARAGRRRSPAAASTRFGATGHPERARRARRRRRLVARRGLRRRGHAVHAGGTKKLPTGASRARRWCVGRPRRRRRRRPARRPTTAPTGEPRWLGPKGGGVSYSSPQLATIDGVAAGRAAEREPA